MATVPLASGRTVQPDAPQPAYSSIRAPASAFGAARAEALGNLAQGIENVGNVANDIVLKNLQQDNRRKAVDLDNQLSDKLRQILQEGQNGQPGYYSRLGEDAINGYDSTAAAIKQAQADVLNQAGNQAVKDMLTPAVNTRINSSLEDIDRHVMQQRKNANDVSDQTRISTAAADAAAAWNSPQVLAQSLGIAKSTADTMSTRNGIQDPTVRGAQTMAASSTVLKATIDAAMLTSVEKASAIFNAHKDQIDGITQAKIQQDLMIQQRAEQAQRDHEIAMADRARTKAVQAAADEWVTKITDPNANVSVQDFTHDPRLNGEGGQKVFLLNLLKATDKADPPSAISAATEHDLMRRILLPQGDPEAVTTNQQIQQEFIDGKLSRAGLQFVQQQLAQAQTPDGRSIATAVNNFTNLMRSTITQSTLATRDAPGDQRFYNFTQMVNKAVSDAQRQGKSAYSLLDPNSPDYLGKPANLKPFLADPTQDMQSTINTISGNAEKNVPAPPSPAANQQRVQILGRQYQQQVDAVDGASDDEKKQAGRALVTEAYRNGSITYDEAAQILRDNNWVK